MSLSSNKTCAGGCGLRLSPQTATVELSSKLPWCADCVSRHFYDFEKNEGESVFIERAISYIDSLSELELWGEIAGISTAANTNNTSVESCATPDESDKDPALVRLRN